MLKGSSGRRQKKEACCHLPPPTHTHSQPHPHPHPHPHNTHQHTPHPSAPAHRLVPPCCEQHRQALALCLCRRHPCHRRCRARGCCCRCVHSHTLECYAAGGGSSCGHRCRGAHIAHRGLRRRGGYAWYALGWGGCHHLCSACAAARGGMQGSVLAPPDLVQHKHSSAKCPTCMPGARPPWPLSAPAHPQH